MWSSWFCMGFFYMFSSSYGCLLTCRWRSSSSYLLISVGERLLCHTPYQFLRWGAVIYRSVCITLTGTIPSCQKLWKHPLVHICRYFAYLVKFCGSRILLLHLFLLNVPSMPNISIKYSCGNCNRRKSLNCSSLNYCTIYDGLKLSAFCYLEYW